VHDRAVACGREVDDLADGGGVFVSGDDQGARRDLAGIAGLVEEGPEVAGLILVVEVSGDVDAVCRRLGAAGAVRGVGSTAATCIWSSPDCGQYQGVRAPMVERAEIPGCGAIKNRRWASYLDVKSRGC
jgi:hypothetical protein